MTNLSRPFRIPVVAACLMFAGVLAVPISAAGQAAGNIAQGRARPLLRRTPSHCES